MTERHGGIDGYRNDTWSLSLIAGQEAWTQVLPAGTLPVVRSVHTVVHDDVGKRMVVFGGGYVGGIYGNDTWSLPD